MGLDSRAQAWQAKARTWRELYKFNVLKLSGLGAGNRRQERQEEMVNQEEETVHRSTGPKHWEAP